MDTTQITARIAELEKERERILTQANQSIAFLHGAIAELQRLLKPPTLPEKQEDKADDHA